VFEDLFRKNNTPADPDREKGKPPLLSAGKNMLGSPGQGGKF
jgi:hypothetical protein